MGRAILSRGHSTNLVPRHTSLPCCPHGTTSNSPSGQDSVLGAHRPVVGRPMLPHFLGWHAQDVLARHPQVQWPSPLHSPHRRRWSRVQSAAWVLRMPARSTTKLSPSHLRHAPPGGGNAFEPCSLGSTDAHHPPSPTRRDRLTVTRALIFVPSNTGALRARGRVGRIRVPLLQGGCPDREDSGDQHTLQTITGNA